MTELACDTGPIATENQFPCRTLVHVWLMHTFITNIVISHQTCDRPCPVPWSSAGTEGA